MEHTMAHGFEKPITEMIRIKRTSAQVIIAASRLRKAVGRKAFPVAAVDSIHPTFFGLRDDHEALAWLAEDAGLAMRGRDGETVLVPAELAEGQLPSPARPPSRPGPPDPAPARPVSKSASSLRVAVADRVVLFWTKPISKAETDRRLTIRPGADRIGRKGMPRKASRIVTLLLQGLPYTPTHISSELGMPADEVVEAVNLLIARRIVVDADDPVTAHWRSAEWSGICAAVLRSVPADDLVPVTTLIRKAKRIATAGEVRKAVAYLEERALIHPFDHPPRYSTTPGMNPAVASQLAEARARRTEPTRIVDDEVVLDWTAPILSADDERGFVAYPFIEGDDIEGLDPETLDVLELLRDYVPRNAAKVALRLGIAIGEARDRLNQLVDRGLAVDGSPLKDAWRTSRDWRRCCHAVLEHSRGTASAILDDMPQSVVDACGKDRVEHAIRYLVARGLLSRGRD